MPFHTTASPVEREAISAEQKLGVGHDTSAKPCTGAIRCGTAHCNGAGAVVVVTETDAGGAEVEPGDAADRDCGWSAEHADPTTPSVTAVIPTNRSILTRGKPSTDR